MSLKARNQATRVRDHWTRVFISHKEEDKELAFAVRAVLESGSGSLRCFVSGSDYSGDWLATIRSELRSADVLLLLFTSPAKQWDWPLYEVGLFTPIEETAPQGAIVYLYSGESRPKPLEHLQGVRVDPANLKVLQVFLGKFYRTAEITRRDPPLNPGIADGEILDQARKICSAFIAASTVPLYPTYRISLAPPRDCAAGLGVATGALPRDCRVEDVTPSTLSIFGLADRPATWGEVLDAIEADEMWKNELDAEFTRAAGGRIANPTTSTFLGLQDGRSFRAMITKLERAETRILRIVIAFIPEPTPAVVGGPAFNLLRLATRFQTEVISRFCGELEKLAAHHGKDRTLSLLHGAIRHIERESGHLRFTDPPTVCAVFSEGNSDRATVLNMFSEWGHLRAEIISAIRDGELAPIETCLARLRKSNAGFLSMIARRHCELIARDAQRVLDEGAGNQGPLPCAPNGPPPAAAAR